ncbi:MAG: CHC2 zinc finger domain-containing protein, partial [Patescibacteria group bacterium]|nr:CHC2 zinc finger domain-containing protein [Patescibacteria group bacterium]
ATTLDKKFIVWYNGSIMLYNILKEKEFILDLIIHGNIHWEDWKQKFLEKNVISEDEALYIDQIVERLKELEKSYEDEMIKIQDDKKVLREFFPELIDDEQFYQSLKDNLSYWRERFSKLKSVLINNGDLIKTFPVLENDLNNQVFEAIFQINRLVNLIEFIELKKLYKEKKDKEPIKEIFEDLRPFFDIDLVYLIQNETGVQLKKAGNIYTTNCVLPFHADKNPSFVIYPTTNSFYCFGCQRGGNVVNFIKEYHGLSFYEALKYLKDKYL